MQFDARFFVSTFESAVAELVCTYIGDNAKTIAVTIDPSQLKATVDSDGIGVGETGFQTLGEPLRGEHGASRCGAHSFWRSSNEVVAALAVHSSFTITSRRHAEFQTWQKVFRGSDGTRLSLASQQWARHGTVVHLDGFLAYDLIRRAQLMRASAREVMESVRNAIVDATLPYCDVRITLSDACTKKQLLLLRKGRALLDVWPAVFGDVPVRTAQIDTPEGFQLNSAFARCPSNAGIGAHVYINKQKVSPAGIAQQAQDMIQALQRKSKPKRRKADAFSLCFLVECPPAAFRINGFTPEGATIEFLQPQILQSLLSAAVRTAFKESATGEADFPPQPTAHRKSTSENSLRPRSQILKLPSVAGKQEFRQRHKSWHPGQEACGVEQQGSEIQLGMHHTGSSTQLSRSCPAMQQHTSVRESGRSVQHKGRLLKRPVVQPHVRHATSQQLVAEHDVDTGESSAGRQVAASMRQPSAATAHCRAASADAAKIRRTPDPMGTSFLPSRQSDRERGHLYTLLQTWENSFLPDEQTILRVEDLQVNPGRVTRDHLQDGRVLNQLALKFVPVLSCGVLLVLDQHAADERVRLESLQAQVVGPGALLGSRQLQPPTEMRLASVEQMAAATWPRALADWGWALQVDGLAGTATVTAVPELLGRLFTLQDLQEFLYQLAETRGAGAAIGPPALGRLLASKACRSAIMFGDPLPPSAAAELLRALATTRDCFHCAHGRPTVAPLADLRQVSKALASRAEIPVKGGKGHPVPLAALKARLLTFLQQ